MIEILKFELINKGSLLAKFSVKMHKWGGLIIRDCALFESGERKWVNLPSRAYEVDGKKKYSEYLFYEDRAINEKFKESILKAAEQIKNNLPETYAKEELGEIPF